MLVVDTNVLVYAANVDSPFHRTCRDWLDRQRARPDAWYTTWPIVYEFLRVVTHARVLDRPWTAGAAWSFITALLASPGFGLLVPTERHQEIAAAVLAEYPHIGGNLFHDTHTAILMREHGIRRICTRDVDFTRFKFLEALDPVAG